MPGVVAVANRPMIEASMKADVLTRHGRSPMVATIVPMSIVAAALTDPMIAMMFDCVSIMIAMGALLTRIAGTVTVAIMIACFSQHRAGHQRDCQGGGKNAFHRKSPRKKVESFDHGATIVRCS
jgi:hypothetical protein